MYFNECKTAEELKKAYRKQAAKLHPDNNPGKDTTAEFQNMQAEFEKAWDRLKTVHESASGETYTKETTETAAEFMDIINQLLHMPGVIVEICGSWIWCTGDTKPHKEKLKAMGFHWSAKKTAWNWHKDPWFKKGREKSLDEIRKMYGSVTFEKTDTELSA